jgi:hypothetical protein
LLHVLHLDQHRVVRAGHPDADRLQRALDAARHDRLLLTVLDAAQQLLAEVIVHRRVGAAARRARERHGLGAGAVAAHQQFGAGSHEGQVRRADAPAEAGREDLPQRAEHGAGVVLRGGVGAHLAGEHDLLELAGAGCARRARSTACS